MLSPATRYLSKQFFPIAILVASMWLTRSHHFATTTSLPDASWAAFFLAGMLSRRRLVPATLMINAGLIDYLALLGGVSDYCVTPAYPFLIPTYLVLWRAGRWAESSSVDYVRELTRTAVALLAGVLSAFIISNASFYVFSGYFDQMSALTYCRTVAKYLPSFLQSTAIYTVFALGMKVAWHHFPYPPGRGGSAFRLSAKACMYM